MTESILHHFDVTDAVAAIVGHYRLHAHLHPDDAVSEELRKVLRLLPDVKAVECADLHGDPGHHVGGFLADALSPKAGAVNDVLEALKPLAPVLPWRYGYEARTELPGLEHRMAWAEFVGPKAPIHSDGVCLGITLIAPYTLYPAHHHPAVESYFVLSGTALWTASGIARALPPCSFILHPENVIHSMEAGDEPLLAAYTWTGDILTDSAYD